jgi:hypothetical protein
MTICTEDFDAIEQELAMLADNLINACVPLDELDELASYEYNTEEWVN